MSTSTKRTSIPRLCRARLHAVLDALEADHDFLLQGGVFSKDIIESYIGYKRVEEADAVAMRPHPYEFELYLGC